MINVQYQGQWYQFGSMADAKAFRENVGLLKKPTETVTKTVEVAETPFDPDAPCPRCQGTRVYTWHSRVRGAMGEPDRYVKREGSCYACVGGGVYRPGWKTGPTGLVAQGASTPEVCEGVEPEATLVLPAAETVTAPKTEKKPRTRKKKAAADA